jgi:hypothetical protein
MATWPPGFVHPCCRSYRNSRSKTGGAADPTVLKYVSVVPNFFNTRNSSDLPKFPEVPHAEIEALGVLF